MPSDFAPSLPNSYALQGALTGDLNADYERMREELVALMTEPVKDFASIDQLVDRLERVQLAIKGEHGVKGNNPNE